MKNYEVTLFIMGLPYSEHNTRVVEVEANSQDEAEQKAQAAAASAPIKTFAEDKDMLIKNGRYGAYIAYKGKNYRLPKGAKIETLTYTECQRIIAKSKK